MRVTVSTEASDSMSIAFSTFSRSSRTRSKISLAVRAWPARSVSIGTPSVTGLFWPRQTPGIAALPGGEQAVEIGGGDAPDFFRGDAAHFSQNARRFRHKGGLIALAPVRNGSEIRGV